MPGRPVEVIRDPALVASAHKAWRTRAQPWLDHLLQNPEELVEHDRTTRAFLQEHRNDFVAELTRRWLSRAGFALQRLHALRVIRSLGAPVSPEALVAAAVESTDAGILLLNTLDQFVGESEPLPEALRDFVLQALRSENDALRAAALNEVNVRNLREAEPHLDVALDESPEEPNLLLALARLRPTAETLERVQAALDLNPPRERLPGFVPLIEFGRATPDPALRGAAAEFVVDQLARIYRADQTSAEIHAALDWLAALPDRAEAIALLERVAQEPNVHRYRLSALNRLSRLDADEIARRDGFELEEDSADFFGFEEEPPITDGRLLTEWAEEFVASGIFSPAEVEIARRSWDNECPRPRATAATDALVQLASATNRAVAANAEFQQAVFRHDWVVLECAANSAGKFRPEAVFEDFDSGAARRTFEFIHDGRLYRTRVLSDEADVHAVWELVEQALADAGVKERFVWAEPPSDESWLLLFADPERIRAAGIQFEDKRA